MGLVTHSVGGGAYLLPLSARLLDPSSFLTPGYSQLRKCSEYKAVIYMLVCITC